MIHPAILLAIAVLAATPAAAADGSPMAMGTVCTQSKAKRIQKVMETMHLAGNANIDDAGVRQQIANDKCKEIADDGPRQQCQATYRTILNYAQQAQAKLTESCNEWLDSKSTKCIAAQTDCPAKLQNLMSDAASKFDEALQLLEQGRKSVAGMTHQNRRAIEELESQIGSGKLSPHDRNVAEVELAQLREAREASVNFSGDNGFAPTEIKRLKDLREQFIGKGDKIGGNVDRMGPIPDGKGSTITGQGRDGHLPSSPSAPPAAPSLSPPSGGGTAGGASPRDSGTRDSAAPVSGRTHEDPLAASASTPSVATAPATANNPLAPGQDRDDDPFKSGIGSLVALAPASHTGSEHAMAAPVVDASAPPASKSAADKPQATPMAKEEVAGAASSNVSPEEKTASAKPASSRTEEAIVPSFSGYLSNTPGPQSYGHAATHQGDSSTFSSRAPASYQAPPPISFSSPESPAQIETGRKALANPEVKRFVDKEVAHIEKDHPLTEALRESLRRKLASRMADQMEETRIKNAVAGGSGGALAAVFGAAAVSKSAPENTAALEDAFRLGAAETDAEVKRLLGRETEEKLSEIPGAYSAQSLFERVHGAHTRFAKR